MKVLQILDDINHRMILRGIQLLDVEKTRTIEQQDTIIYALACIINEIEKIVFLTIVFGIQGSVIKFWTSFLGLVSLRIFIGGMHRKTTLGCLIQSFLSFETIMILDERFQLSIWMNCFVWIILVILIWKQAPIVSKNRVHYNELQRMRFKAIAITVLLVDFMIISILSNTYTNCLSWTIAFQMLESGVVALKIWKDKQNE